MKRMVLATLSGAVLVAACSNEEGNRSSGDDDSSANGTPAAAVAPATTAGERTAWQPPVQARPLSNAEQSRLRSIAGSVERAIALFDGSVPECPKSIREACADRAWAILVGDLEW